MGESSDLAVNSMVPEATILWGELALNSLLMAEEMSWLGLGEKTSKAKARAVPPPARRISKRPMMSPVFERFFGWGLRGVGEVGLGDIVVCPVGFSSMKLLWLC